MKNIQVIDGAVNSVFEIYAIEDSLFYRLFPNGAEIAFTSDCPKSDPIWEGLYKIRVLKSQVRGIHGTLHLDLSEANPEHFPNRKESDVYLPHIPKDER